jgi:outer membrane protein assembly factor BamA
VLGTDSTGGIRDPVQRTQIVEDYTRPQVNSALRYTLRSSSVNPLRREEGHQYEAAVEVGNTLTFLLDRFAFTPGTVEYSLPGLPGDAQNRLIYRPYVRAIGDLRRYAPVGPTTTVAAKLYAGVAHPTAGPNLVPFDRRFFSGGASSVRGWRLRELGPGAAALEVDDASGDVANILGGDIKLESSVELRQTLIGSLFTARWIGTTFVDAGNVWFGPRNPGLDGRGDGRDGVFRVPAFLGELGVSSGVGLRLAWDYLIVRLDLAYPLNDPSPQNDDIFADRFSGPLLHFGIGHTF